MTGVVQNLATGDETHRVAEDNIYILPLWIPSTNEEMFTGRDEPFSTTREKCESCTTNLFHSGEMPPERRSRKRVHEGRLKQSEVILVQETTEGSDGVREAYEVPHVLLRSWCSVCVQSQRSGLTTQITGGRGGGKHTGTPGHLLLSHVVHCRYAGTEWITALLGGDLRDVGIAEHARVTLKSSQKPTLVDLLKDV